MNSTQIECFLSVAEYLSFSRAAEALFMTQTSVTYQVASLEKELSAQLFDRSNRKVELSPAGRAFLQWARKIDGNVREAKMRVRSVQQGLFGHLSIGTYGDVLFPYLPGILSKLRNQHPGISLDLRQRGAHGLISELSSGDIDVAIMTAYGQLAAEQSWTETVTLFRDTHCVVLPAAHPLANRESVTMEELTGERLLLFAEKDLLQREDVPDAFEDVRFFDSPQSVVALTASGFGISIAVSHICDRHNPNLAIVPVADSYMDICACFRRNNAAPEIASLLAIIKEVVPQAMA